MPRAPCCDQKLGLKKGPWTREEDQILINYVQNHGHANWRALPKQAGLLRCGKSCRLRWINYLQPDIKRGNFTREEEDTIIHLHQTLGNRWSAIAARLPGRTDNEIKNVWHTHLKKRLNKNPSVGTNPEVDTKAVQEPALSSYDSDANNNNNVTSRSSAAELSYESDAPQQSSLSCSEYSSLSASVAGNINIGDLFTDEMSMDMFESFPEIDGSFFWTHDSNMESNAAESFSADDDDGMMDFWYNVLLQAEENLPLLEC